MKKILFTSICRPIGPDYGDAPSVGYELLYGQVTRAQGLFSPRALHLHFSMEYIAENLETPAVVLQVDHIVPVCDGGSDDEINLVTSCWSCNSGKAGVPLESVLTAEDPNDRAIMLLERERQLREYNYVLACIRERREEFGQDLLNYWCENSGATGILKREFAWLCRQLEFVPAEVIRKAMGIAISREATDGLRYVVACLRNWREDGTI